MTIYVPIIKEAKTFQAFEARGVEKALRLLEDPAYRKEQDPASTDSRVYRAVFMPELVDARNLAADRGEHYIWNTWYATPSIRATGRSKANNPVVVYVHGSNPFSTADGITAAVDAGLANGAGKMTPQAFYALLDRQDDKTVFVVDYDKLRKSSSKVISVEEARTHPQTIAFLGGAERAERYLTNYEKVHGIDKIGVLHSDDLGEEPRGRVLFLGNYHCYGLLGGGHLDNDGRFLGVAPEAHISLEEAVAKALRFVPEDQRQAFEVAMRIMYIYGIQP